MRTSARGEQQLPEFDGLADMAVVLPHLRACVQPQLFPGWQIAEGRVGSVRNRTYGRDKRSKSSALLRYELSLEKSVAKETGVRPESKRSELYLKAFLNGRGSKIDRQDRALLTTVPELDAYAWVFPGDPEMAILSDLVDPLRVRAFLPNGFGDSDRFEVERLRYKPEDRCTLRVTEDRGQANRTAVIGKVFSSSNRAVDLFEIATTLHKCSQRPPMLFKIPEPLALDRENSTFWISELAGRPPTRASLDHHSVSRIAAALVSFHRCKPLVNGAPRTFIDQLVETAERATVLSELVPAFQPRIAALLDRLEDEVGDLGSSNIGNIHGAFRMRQLIIDGSDIGLIDFDSLALGDPVEDVVDMMLDIGPGSDPGPDRTGLARRFLADYETALGKKLDQRQVRWQVPVQLLKRAYWLRHSALRRPDVGLELARRVDRACDPTSADLLGVDR